MAGYSIKNWVDEANHAGPPAVPPGTPLSAVAMEDAEDRLSTYTTMLAGTSAGIFNVKDYGADGAGDDVTPIQNAIDACGAAGGGVVYFPPDNYTIGSALTMGSAASKVALVGAAGGGLDTQSAKLTYTGSGTALFIDQPAAYTAVKNLHIYAASATCGVFLGDNKADVDFEANAAGCLGPRLDQVIIDGFDYGIEANQVYLGGFSRGAIRDYQYGVLIKNNCNDFWISDTHFYGGGTITMAGVNLNRGGTAANLANGNTHIRGCMFENQGTATCIYNRDGVHTHIEGNTFGDGAYGVVVEDSADTGYAADENEGTIIVGNDFQVQSSSSVKIDFGPSGGKRATVIEGNRGGQLELVSVGNLLLGPRNQFSSFNFDALYGGCWLTGQDDWEVFNGPQGQENLITGNANFKYGATTNWTTVPGALTANVSANGPNTGAGIPKIVGSQYNVTTSTTTEGYPNYAYLESDAITVDTNTALTCAVWVAWANQTANLKVEIVTAGGTALGQAPLGTNSASQPYMVHCYANSAGNSSVKVRLYFNETNSIIWSGVHLVQGFYSPGELGWNWTPRATAAPAGGNWLQNDIVWNSDADATDYIGWVCTVAGSPGTWKGFGAIEA